MNVHVHPYDYAEAKAAIERASANQLACEQTLRDSARQLGEAERAYRKALAAKIVELRADGTAATVAADIARGDSKVADLRYARDVAEGVREAAQPAAWRHSADRRELEQLINWSQRLALDGQPPEGALARAA